MAHYAKVLDGVVLKVIVAEEDFFDNFVDTVAGDWIKTSYNTYGGVHTLGGTPLRMNYATVGGTYDIDRDAFIGLKEWPSWVLDEDTLLWKPPIDYPTDGKDYKWVEEEVSWVLAVFQYIKYLFMGQLTMLVKNNGVIYTLRLAVSPVQAGQTLSITDQY